MDVYDYVHTGSFFYIFFYIILGHQSTQALWTYIIGAKNIINRNTVGLINEPLISMYSFRN
jgi:hypothetical protein